MSWIQFPRATLSSGKNIILGGEKSVISQLESLSCVLQIFLFSNIKNYLELLIFLILPFSSAVTRRVVGRLCPLAVFWLAPKMSR